MIGMVLVTHGGLAAEFVATLEHIVEEPVEATAIVSIGPDDDMEQRRNELLEKVAAVDDGSGVVVLTDMFGGTPSNLAISILEAGKVEVVAGVNLPMLIKLAAVRDTMPIARAAEAAKEAARKNINVASSLLANRAT
jgi:PTS system mannose-specific IIA component